MSPFGGKRLDRVFGRQYLGDPMASVPQMPVLWNHPYKIKAFGTDSWMVIGEDGAVELALTTAYVGCAVTG